MHHVDVLKTEIIKFLCHNALVSGGFFYASCRNLFRVRLA